jgi:hypothetical protein
MRDPRFNYKGYTYQPEYEIEADYDNAKIWHEIVKPDGTRTHADFTPYSYMTEEDFQLYIDLGMPERITVNRVSCPLRSETLKDIQMMRAFENHVDSQ